MRYGHPFVSAPCLGPWPSESVGGRLPDTLTSLGKQGGSGFEDPDRVGQELAGFGTTRALAMPLLGEHDGNGEILHPNLPSLGAFRIVRLGADAPV